MEVFIDAAGNCWEQQWVDNPNFRGSNVLDPEGDYKTVQVDCPDAGGGGGSGWTTGGSGTTGGGGAFAGSSSGNSGNPKPPNTLCNIGNGYEIPVDKTCTCCDQINLILDDLEFRLHNGGDLSTKLRGLFFCGGKTNPYILPLLNCLTSEEWNQTVKNISCDSNVIYDMNKGGGVAHFQAYPQDIRGVHYNGSTIYVNCALSGPNLESILFHEFVHACEQSIFKFSQSDIDKGKNSELDAYILQQFLFPNTPPPGLDTTTYQRIQTTSNLISGGLPDPHFLYGQFFALDEENHRFFTRTTKGDGNANIISDCGIDTPVFKSVVKYTGGQNPAIIYYGGSGLSNFGNYPDQNAVVNNNNASVLTGFNQVSSAFKNGLSLF